MKFTIQVLIESADALPDRRMLSGVAETAGAALTRLLVGMKES